MSYLEGITVLVWGQAVTALAAVRALGRHGVAVKAFDHRPSPLMKASRYAEFSVCPHPLTDEDGLIEFCSRLGKETFWQRLIVLPTSDEFVSFFYRRRLVLPANFRTLFPPNNLVEDLLSKSGQYELARRYGMPAPMTVSWSPASEDLPALVKDLKFPILVKGSHTVTWRRAFGERKALTIPRPQDLPAVLKEIQAAGCDVVFQEIIPGPDTAHWKYCLLRDENGKILHEMTLQKIRQYPCHFGIGSCVVSRRNEALLSLGRKFFTRMNYWGIGSMEVKWDERDQEFKMIEINPRLWAQHGLAEACGQNFPLTYAEHLAFLRPHSQLRFAEGVKWIAFGADRASFQGYHREGRLSWRAWIQSWLTGRRVWAYACQDDFGPCWQTLRLRERFLSRLRSRPASARDEADVPSSRHGQSSSIPHDIRMEIVSDERRFRDLRAEWNHLAQESGLNNPFLRHEWLSAWRRAYGKGKSFIALIFRNSADECVAALPLMKRNERLCGMPLSCWGFWANHWTRMNVLSRPSEISAVAALLAEFFQQQKMVVLLAQMGPEREMFQAFKQALEAQSFRVRETQRVHIRVVSPGSFEAFFQSQSRNYRMDSRRKERRLEKEGRVNFIMTPLTDEKELEDLIRIASNGWQTQEGVGLLGSDQGRHFYNALIEENREWGAVQAAVLFSGDSPVAYLVGLREGETFFAFDTAFDRRYAAYSPGLVLHNRVMEHLFHQGVGVLDLGFDAGYKHRWQAECYTVNDLIALPSTPEGWMMNNLLQIKQIGRKVRGKT